MYLADFNNDRVVEVSAAGVTSVVNVGAPGGKNLSFTQDVAVDAAGDLYIADTGNERVVEDAPNVNFGNVPVNSAATANQQTLTYTFSSNDTLTAVNVLTQGASNKDFTADSSSTCVPNGVYGPSGADTCTVVVDLSPKAPGLRMGAVQLVDANGVQATTYLRAVGQGPQAAFQPGVASVVSTTGLSGGSTSYGCTATALCYPQQVAVDGAGDVFIADTNNFRVVKVTPAGVSSVLNVGSPGGTPLGSVEGLAVDGAGNLYISDSYNFRIVELTPAGISSVVNVGSPGGTSINGPSGLAVDGIGNLYIADEDNNRVLKYSASGGTLMLNTAGLPGTAAGALASCPTSGLCSADTVAVDAAENVYITDYYNNRVVELSPAGVATVLNTASLPGALDAEAANGCPTSGLCYPFGVAVDGAGNIYIADSGNNRIAQVTPAGVASVFNTSTIPNGILCNGLCLPFALATDAAGDLYIADADNFRIDEISQAQPAPLTFAATSDGYTSSDSPQNVILQNIGNQQLILSAVATATAGQSADSFNLDGTATTCSGSTSLNPGDTCGLGVEFEPLSSGPLSGSVSITDNNLYSSLPTVITQQITLSGTGVGYEATIGLEESSTSVVYGTAVSVTATLTGTNGVPTGSVIYSVDGVTLGTAPLTAGATSSSAQISLPATINAGIHGVEVTYAGDANYYAPSAAGFSLTVTAASTTTSLSAPGTATAGSYITLTATVLSGSTPVTSGLVVFGYTNIIGPGAGISIGAAGSAKPQASSGTMYYTLGVGLLGTGGQATLYTTLPAGNYTIAAFYEGSLDYATSYSTGSNIAFSAVPPAATTTSLSAPATAVAGNSVNLTATVLAGSTPVTSGTVTFASGTLSIGAAQLGSGGTATLATTLLPVGNDSVSASFLGTTSYATSTSSSSTVVVSAVTAPSYSISANPTSVSIAQGATGSITLTFTPVGGYSGTVLLSCGNLPSFVTCAFTQGGTADSTVVMSGNNQPVTVILTISTNVSTARLNALPGSRPNSPQSPAAPLLTAMVFWLPGGMAGIVAFSRRRKFTGKNRWLPLCLIGVVALALAAGLSACGGSGSVTPAGATTITVTATPSTGNNPSSSSQTLTLTLTITS